MRSQYGYDILCVIETEKQFRFLSNNRPKEKVLCIIFLENGIQPLNFLLWIHRQFHFEEECFEVTGQTTGPT